MNRLPFALLILAPVLAQGQGTQADFDRADRLGREARGLVVRDQLQFHWAEGDSRLVYRVNSGRNSHEFHAVDLAAGEKELAFDHEALSQALATALEREVPARRLPLEGIEPAAEGRVIRFRAYGRGWSYDPESGVLGEIEFEASTSDLLPPEAVNRGSRRTGENTTLTFQNATDGEIEIFWVQGGGERTSYGRIPAGGEHVQNTYGGHMWLAARADGEPLAAVEAPDAPGIARVEGRVRAPQGGGRRGGGGGQRGGPQGNVSPDGTWQVRIRDHNVVLEAREGDEVVVLSEDGSAEHPYEAPFFWAPDSSRLIAHRTRRVEQRQIHIVESSPSDQLQPKLRTLNYTKPGDEIRQPKPRLFDVEEMAQVPLDEELFENPYDTRNLAWAADSSEFTFIYNQRGHQVLRLVGVARDGSVRSVFEDSSETFLDYSQKMWFRRIADEGVVLWASERSGYNHLYRIDERTGEVINAITSGPWNVREVVDFDEAAGSLLLRVFGIHSDQDPYHAHFARVNTDGSGFTVLTESDGHHRIDFSPDRKFLIATWSRVDQPPVVELRRADDGSLVTRLEEADDSALRATGWSRPERFVAKGRDGETDIWGIIVKPSNFDPERTYPVVEDIYAGPHDHFVPKGYNPWSGMNRRAEFGLILVKIDGMGTNWRSKEFHDVAWKNLADSGFPDRIPWIRAAAETRPWMDLDRVGIYGGSAGGQSTLSALLHHGDFYHVGISDCGCHDNRMDKIWWNEAWMGWPVDDSYEENSNTTHAHKLQGKLLLIVGELDSNVDPASTMQVVHALQQADKDFDFLPIVNAGHGAAGTPYGRRRSDDFLIRHLLGVEPRQ